PLLARGRRGVGSVRRVVALADANPDALEVGPAEAHLDRTPRPVGARIGRDVAEEVAALELGDDPVVGFFGLLDRLRAPRRPAGPRVTWAICCRCRRCSVRLACDWFSRKPMA